ncbi:MAG: intermembrane transport protein PqiB [Luteolibacter sp.]
MSEPKLSPAVDPEFRAAQRWNIVWVVPIIALLIGSWMIYRNFSSKGPVARVGFETADGIAAGKTDVRCRSVKVGIVKKVKLTDDLKSVLVTLELDPDSEGLLRNGTHFWVVRPRVSTTDVSGLGTLLTGAYIELDPGPLEGGIINDFMGLETPLPTNRNIPGRRLVLTASEAGSLVAGSPIYYRGLDVGRVEKRELDADGRTVTYDAFIREEFSMLVKENTRFWNTSGIDISAGADGFKIRTPSLQAMVSGGATFGVPEGLQAGKPAADGMTFTLFADEDAANGSTFNPTMKFLLLFEQSVRGLSRSAPVEFRGIVIGRVADISLDYLKQSDDSRIPVLIEIDPSLLRRETADKVLNPDSEFLKSSVKQGLRAALKAGNLLTGALFVDLDYYKEAAPAEIAMTGDLKTLPTVSSGLAQLEAKVTAILDKVQALPLDDTMKKFAAAADEATQTMVELKQTVAAGRKTLDDPEFRKLPADLRESLAKLDKSISSYGPEGPIQGDMLRTLEELRAALRALKAVSTTVDEKPNSLLFGRDSSGNPIPKAPSGKR